MSEHLSEDHATGFSDQRLADELLAVPKAAEADAPFEYEFLRHSRADHPGEETSEELRARYVRYTGKLIAEVKDMVDPEAPAGPDGLKDTGVTMVFLDKSARPSYWMMDELWDLYAPGYKRPEIKFANIDREDWQEQTGRIDIDTGTNDVDVGRLDESVFRNLRDTFRNPEKPDESVFAGRKIMVVDETRTTGTTLEIAKQMFERTFEDAREVTAYHWMVRPSGSQKTADVPVWYMKDSPHGRGVGDRDIEYSQRDPKNRSESVQFRGAQFLSTGPRDPDSMSLAIRREIHQVREDMLSGRMRFSVQNHEDDDIDPRLLRAVTPWRERQRERNAQGRRSAA